ncbi:MAG TPA: Gfo/Idh/MocA family oxidoreductase [Blastocatellia bacterium]|nr:Gfo/Idh/MocA family oxidoreductase [Blastocatellia bacterium]
MIRVAVVGAGHFGRQHARVYGSVQGARLVAVCDVNEETGRSVASQLGVEYASDFRQLIGKVDAISLAVPTVEHHAVASELIDAGIGVLVEKPITRTLEEADDLIRLATRSKGVLQVGHLERFNPAVMAARGIATSPRFFEAHRLSVFTPRSLDIDVVMDLMIHDLDVVLSLVKSPVSEIRAAGVPVVTPRVDIANARIEFENGCVANLTASRVSGDKVRKLRFFQPNQYVSIDYSLQEATTVAVRGTGAGLVPEFEARSLPVVRDEPLRLEIASFLSAVSGGKVEVAGTDGRRALELALGVTGRIAEHALKILTGSPPGSSN